VDSGSTPWRRPNAAVGVAAFSAMDVVPHGNLSGGEIFFCIEEMEASMRASITCPSTGEVVTLSVQTDAATVTKAWKQFIRMQGPHCDERHAIPYKDVYIDGVLANLTDSNLTMFTMLPDVPKQWVKQQRA
jgi:hypothetical protein